MALDIEVSRLLLVENSQAPISIPNGLSFRKNGANLEMSINGGPYLAVVTSVVGALGLVGVGATYSNPVAAVSIPQGSAINFDGTAIGVLGATCIRSQNINNLTLRIQGNDYVQFSGSGLTTQMFIAAGLTVQPSVADGATAIAMILNSGQLLTNASALLWSVQNQGTQKRAWDLNGKDIIPTGGAAAVSGTLTLNGATGVTVSTTAVRTGSRFRLSRHTAGGTMAHFSVTAIVDQTSFTVTGTAGDTSTVDWEIVS